MMTTLNIIRQRMNALGLHYLSINDMVRRYRCHDDTWLAPRAIVLRDLAEMNDRHFAAMANFDENSAARRVVAAMEVTR